MPDQDQPAPSEGPPPELEPEPEAEPGPEPRRYPSTIGGLFYLVVLGGTAVGVGIVASGDWRLGIRCVGAALGFAAVCRLVLPTRDAGMLAVRSRWFDSFVLVVLGAALFFLVATIPDQPG